MGADGVAVEIVGTCRRRDGGAADIALELTALARLDVEEKGGVLLHMYG